MIHVNGLFFAAISAGPRAALAKQGFRAVRIGGLEADQPAQSLLLHGFTGLAEDWCACWPNTVPALAIDLPGHGGSIAPEGAFDQALIRLLAALPASIERVIGYSLGGRLALGLLRLAPQRFATAIILSAHPGLSDPRARARRRAADQCWIDRLEHQGIAAFVDAWESLPLFATQVSASAQQRAQQRERRLSQTAAGLAASLRVHGLAEMPSMRETIIRYPGELHWVVGTEDHKFSALAREVEHWRPSMRLHLLPGVGHNSLLEAPDKLRLLMASIATAYSQPRL